MITVTAKQQPLKRAKRQTTKFTSANSKKKKKKRLELNKLYHIENLKTSGTLIDLIKAAQNDLGFPLYLQI